MSGDIPMSRVFAGILGGSAVASSGEFAYFCKLHPHMTGVITVE